MKMYLSEDVISNFQFHIYGRRGDCVTVISEITEHNNTVIVEDKDGNRFPASVKVLSKEKVNPNPVQTNPEPVKPTKGKKKVVHSSLFK